MDKRVVKTRQLLQQALLTLMRAQPLEAIEIQAITDAANTARVTFYRHYATKEELLLDTLEGFYEQLKGELEGLTAPNMLGIQEHPAECALFAFLESDRPLHKTLLTGSASALIQQRLRQYIVEQVALKLSAAPGQAALPVGLIGHHIASNLIGNIMWWLGDDLPYSGEYMAHLTHRLAWLGARALVDPAEQASLLALAPYPPGQA